MTTQISCDDITIAAHVLDKLSVDIKELQEKYEFERYAKEKWEIVASSFGLRSPEALESWLKMNK